FDRQALAMGDLFLALRVAQLELENSYRPEIHDAYLQSYDWTGFAREELLSIPAVIGLERSSRMVDRMRPLSELLLSARPLQILILADPISGVEGSPGRLFADHRLELGYLGIAHRVALVHQGSVAKPRELLKGFASAAESTRCSLHLIDWPAAEAGSAADLHPLIRAGASVEGRAHPLFCFDPEAGGTWRRQLVIRGNPEPEQDWPQGEVVLGEGEDSGQAISLAFTLADYAILDPRTQGEFMPLPAGFEHEALIGLRDYLLLEEGEKAARIPFVWVSTGDRRLGRLVVSRSLCRATSDRQAYWHCLQELAGIHNEYAEIAFETARKEAAAEAAREREELEARHRDELADLQERAASEAMQGLASMLLDLDVESLTDLGQERPVPIIVDAESPDALPVVEPQREEKPPEPVEADARAEAAEDVGFDEPWVDTPLCTSCDDCTNLNPRLFVYDENKQVLIGDASAGSYAQLVIAAEKCPAKCIHPGQPQNPNEENLEQLVKRAAAFQ
ncbi:MAG: ferredoxin, partial [Planctomycetota bacterium]